MKARVTVSAREPDNIERRRKDKLRHIIETSTLFLALFTTAATCFSTYFAYRTVALYTDQSARESRKEILEMLALVGGLVKGLSDEAKSRELSCPSDQKGAPTK